MTNRDVVNAFIDGHYATTANLRSTGDRIWSYNYCLAERKPGYIRIHDERTHPYSHSKTTQTHRNAVKRALDAANMKYEVSS